MRMIIFMVTAMNMIMATVMFMFMVRHTVMVCIWL